MSLKYHLSLINNHKHFYLQDTEEESTSRQGEGSSWTEFIIVQEREKHRFKDWVFF